jgi:hypothetical protein
MRQGRELDGQPLPAENVVDAALPLYRRASPVWKRSAWPRWKRTRSAAAFSVPVCGPASLRVPSMRNHETLTGLVRETDQRSLVQESHATASNLRQGFRGTSPIFPLMLVRGRYDSRPGVHPDR